MKLEVGQKVKHPVNNPMYGQTFNGCIYGTVTQLFDNGSYRISTKSSEVVMRDSSVAIPITDEEFELITQPRPTPTVTTHSKPTPTKTTVEQPPKEKTVRPKRNAEGPSKKELAKEIYDNMVASGVPFTRADLKKRYQEELGMSEAGSSTYSYYVM